MNEQNPPLIEFRSVRKLFGSFVANDELNLKIHQGEIHAIIGENGAGKTTAMKLLFGLEEPTSGQILYKGEPRPWFGPRDAASAGIGMVHQHFMLSGFHTALENVILGREHASLNREGPLKRKFLSGFLQIDRVKIRDELDRVACKVGFNIPWDCSVENLPVGLQQQLEIVKLLYSGVDVMIFDEPTAVLTPQETSHFLQMLKDLKNDGKTIVIITHKLQEVKEVADVVTVLHHGKSVVTRPAKELSIQAMADLMVGRPVKLGELPRLPQKVSENLIEITDLTVVSPGRPNLLSNLNLTVSAGQIVGIAGVEGSGQMELWSFICGPKDYLNKKKLLSGSFKLFGKEALGLRRSDVREISVGIAPRDRLKEAVLIESSLIENDILGHDHEFACGAFPSNQWLDRGKARKQILSRLDGFHIVPCDPDARIDALSGGNQQKFVMSRELTRKPKLFLCAEPTRGVDVGSIELIHGEILKRRDSGSGMLLISSQIEELMALSDKIYVLFSGRIAAVIDRHNFTEGLIGHAMGGGNS